MVTDDRPKRKSCVSLPLPPSNFPESDRPELTELFLQFSLPDPRATPSTRHYLPLQFLGSWYPCALFYTLHSPSLHLRISFAHHDRPWRRWSCSQDAACAYSFHLQASSATVDSVYLALRAAGFPDRRKDPGNWPRVFWWL